jgi:MFS family permease
MTLATRRRASKPFSTQRKHIYTITWEGIPAMMIFFLLGGPFQTSYLLYLGASPLQIGFVQAIPFMSNLMQLVAAFWIQRIENRKLALLFTAGTHRVVWCLCGLIPFVAPLGWQAETYIVICLTAFMANAFGAVIWTSLVGDIVPAKVRGKFIGMRNMILWAVGCTVIWIGGEVLEAFPGGKGFLLLFSFCGICALVNVFFYTRYTNPPFEKSHESNKFKMLLKPFDDRTFFRAMMFIALFALIQGTAVPLFNYVMQSILKISYSSISLVTIVQNAAMMASSYFWGKLTARYATRTLLLWTLPFLAGACLLWGTVTTLPVMAALVLIHIVLGFGLGGYNLLVFNLTIGDTPKSERPMYIAVFSAVTGLAGFVGPIIGGAAYKGMESWSSAAQSMGVSVAAGALLVVITIVLGPRMLRPRPVAKVENR